MTEPALPPDSASPETPPSMRSAPVSTIRLPPLDRGAAVTAFFEALGRRESWIPQRDLYWMFGFLLGLPTPLIVLAADLFVRGLEASPAGVWSCLRANPLHWLLPLHPLLSAVIFGALGTLARDRDRQADALLDRLKKLAETDGLTGLLNHRAFQARIREEASRADREGKPVALLIVDIDHFKKFNDTHGHPAGDQFLQSLAARLVVLVRPYDIVCRYGGEEFVVILPGLDKAGACQAAERIRKEIADSPFSLAGIPPATITLSGGVAIRRPGESIPDWVTRADRRLYAAKRAGRNRIVSMDEA